MTAEMLAYLCHPLVQKEGHRWICKIGFVKGSSRFSAAGAERSFTPGHAMSLLKAALLRRARCKASRRPWALCTGFENEGGPWSSSCHAEATWISSEAVA